MVFVISIVAFVKLCIVYFTSVLALPLDSATMGKRAEPLHRRAEEPDVSDTSTKTDRGHLRRVVEYGRFMLRQQMMAQDACNTKIRLRISDYNSRVNTMQYNDAYAYAVSLLQDQYLREFQDYMRLYVLGGVYADRAEYDTPTDEPASSSDVRRTS